MTSSALDSQHRFGGLVHGHYLALGIDADDTGSDVFQHHFHVATPLFQFHMAFLKGLVGAGQFALSVTQVEHHGVEGRNQHADFVIALQRPLARDRSPWAIRCVAATIS